MHKCCTWWFHSSSEINAVKIDFCLSLLSDTTRKLLQINIQRPSCFSNKLRPINTTFHIFYHFCGNLCIYCFPPYLYRSGNTGEVVSWVPSPRRVSQSERRPDSENSRTRACKELLQTLVKFTYHCTFKANKRKKNKIHHIILICFRSRQYRWIVKKFRWKCIRRVSY